MRPGRGRLGCAQNVGGVVFMLDGDVTFKGGTISNTTAVRARRSRSCDVCTLCTRALSGIVAAHGAGMRRGARWHVVCEQSRCGMSKCRFV